MKSKEADVPYTSVRKSVIQSANPKLNEDKLKLLSKWITERYNIRKKKDVEGLPAPWTDCPVLQKLKFTNVRREHDRATKWLIDNVCSAKDVSIENKILNCILFRLYNKWETCDLIGLPLDFNWIKYSGEIREILETKEETDPNYVFFTSAFNTGGFKAAAGRLTGEQYIPMRPIAFMEHLLRDGIFNKIIACSTPKEVCKLLMNYSGIGEFLAYQMFVDFTYIPEYTFSENHFTIAGPGCILGLSFLFEDADGMTVEEQLFWLRDNSHILGIDFDELFSDLPEHDRVLNIMSLENCFCEFSKYSRAYDALAEGKTPRARVSYNGTGAADKPTKKEKILDDDKRTIPYMGKRITEEEKAILDGLSVDSTVRSRDCYVSTLFDPKPVYDGDELPLPKERKMFQLLGTNGSGKSTIPKGLVNLDKDAYILSTEMAWLSGNMSKGFEGNTKNVEFATVCPNLKVILIGSYDPAKNIAGCDLLIRATMDIALDIINNDEKLKGYHILMEGVVLSSSKWHIEKLRDDFGITPHMLFMDTPLDVCLERLKKRNASQGKESTNTKNVASKHEETKLKQQRCENGEMGYHGVKAIWVDHTMSIPDSINWFIREYLK